MQKKRGAEAKVKTENKVKVEDGDDAGSSRKKARNSAEKVTIDLTDD